MHCEISFEKLKNAVSLTERAAGKHTTLPVLSCILLDVRKGSVQLRSTNLDIGIEVDVPAKSDGEGVFAVPAHTLSTFLSQADGRDQIVRLEAVSGNLTITLAKTKGLLKTLPSEDFPAIPIVDGVGSVELDAAMITKGLKSVWYSASVSSIKPELASVYVYKSENSLVFAATDSFRLAEKRINTQNKTVGMDDMLIPFKNAVEITRTLENTNHPITVSSNKNLVSFKTGDTRITSRIINGVFPDYKQIIPKGFTTECVVLKQDLINSLKLSSVFSDTFNQIHFSIDAKKKVFVVETKNNDIGENRTEIDAALSGEPVEVNFNCKYITDCFQSIDADSVSLQFNGKNKPLVIRPISGEQNFLYLVMPMNR